MSRLWETILNIFNFIGDNSGCHQMPERSFCIKGYVFPICARCTGVFVGQFFAIITLVLGIRINTFFCFAFLGVMGLDWLIQFKGLKESTNKRRFITGLMGGFGLINLYFIIILKVLYYW